MKLKFFTASKPSAVHPKENHDVLFVDRENHTVGVFDGVGGIAGGKKAANWCCDCFKKMLPLESLEKTFANCHSFLKVKGVEAFGHEAATTAAIVKVYLREDVSLVTWGSVGDSRVYHISGGSLIRISNDDSLVTQALARAWLNESQAEKINDAITLKGLDQIQKGLFESRHTLTQAMGIGIMVPELGKFKVKTGDTIVLTSDGVHDNLTREEIEKILSKESKNPASSLVEAAAKVSEGASLRAKADDMSTVVMKVS